MTDFQKPMIMTGSHLKVCYSKAGGGATCTMLAIFALLCFYNRPYLGSALTNLPEIGLYYMCLGEKTSISGKNMRVGGDTSCDNVKNIHLLW